MSDQFVEGDLVVYSGLTTKSNGKSINHYRLAVVKAVGKYDLFVCEPNKSGTEYPFKLPVECASKVNKESIKSIKSNV